MWNQADRTSKRGCLLPSIVVLFTMPILLLLSLVLIWLFREGVARSRLNQRVEKIRTSGLPVDNASMQTYYDSRTDPTDADAWRDVFETLSSPTFVASSKNIPYVGDLTKIPIRGDWESENATREFMKRWESLHQKASALTFTGNPVRFPITFDSFNTQFPALSKARTVARFFLVYGQVAVRDRDSSASLMAIKSQLGTGQLVFGQPLMVSQIVGLALDGMATGLLRDAIENDALNTSDLQELIPLFQSRISIGGEYQAALVGERALALPFFRNPAGRGVEARFAFNRAQDANVYLDVMNDLMAINCDDLDTFRQQIESRETIQQEKMRSGLLANLDAVLTSQILPSFSAFGDVLVRTAMMHRMATLAIGLRLYEDKHGKFPDSLAELAEFSFDASQLMPPGGKPFGYRLESDGAKLWGFSLRRAQSTPNSPPMDVPDEVAGSGENQLWVWNLNASH
jgi:hypothetical protein